MSFYIEHMTNSISDAFSQKLWSKIVQNKCDFKQLFAKKLEHFQFGSSKKQQQKVQLLKI